MLWICVLVFAVVTIGNAAVPSFLSGVKQGSIKTGSIDDPSGLAASRIHDGIYYTHNDHGGRNRVFALDAVTGSLKGILTITGAANADWESIAVAPCGGTAGGSCIYIGDIGNDAGTALNTIYKVREPANIRDQALPILQQLHFTWNQPESECMMVDPSGTVYVVSRVLDGGVVGKIPETGWGAYSVPITQTQPLSLHSGHHDPLGCDISADGKEMLIKGKVAIYYYTIKNNDVLGAVKTPPEHLPYHYVSLGEGIAWTPSGNGYYTLAQHHYSSFYFYQRDGTQTPAPTNPPNSPLFSAGQLTGLIKSFDLDSISGLAASRVHDGIYYVHNDNGDTNRIFAMDPTTGDVMATYTITGATNKDWEDISVGPCSTGGSCIYIADTGNSGGSPSNIIYMVKEPTEIKDMDLPLLDQLHFTWTEGESQCLMVDPKGNAYIISKATGGGKLAELPSSAWTSTTFSIQQTQALSFHTSHSDPLGCDLAANGKDMLIKTQNNVYYYSVSGGDVNAAVQTSVASLPYHQETTGEAIAWTPKADGYYTVGQGHFLPFYYYKRQ